MKSFAALSLLAVVTALLAIAAGQTPEFTRDVYPVLQKAGCAGCHASDGVASATRLKFPEPDAPADEVAAFGQSLGALVDRADPANSLLLRKPTRRVPHTGGVRIVPGSQDEAALRAWVEHLARSAEGAVAAAPSRSVAPAARAALRRLSHSQYDNTVRDLLGEAGNPTRQFPPEDFVDGFKNQIQASSLSPLQVEAYGAAAERLAASAFRDLETARGRGLLPCRPAPGGDAACRDRFIAEFGLRAFRRPLDARERARYTTLFAAQPGFLEGTRIVAEAMLQSPTFLYVLDPDAAPERRAYARAARLAYFLWDSMPDAALFGAAAAGELDGPVGLERAARRLLADTARAGPAVDQFLAQWLRFDQLTNVLKERRAFPQFNRELALAMAEETRLLAADLVWHDRSFMELFSADYTFCNPELAALYGLPAPQSGFARVSYPPGSERAGVLGHGAFLALTSKPAETSPTARGLFVREHFLCQRVPLPPPGVNMNLPALTEERPRTNRERLALHVENESCAGCHRLIDPIGFGFERFDAIGARHEKQRVALPRRGKKETETVTLELDVDTRGVIAGIEGAEFASPRELGRILASNPQCQECVVKQLFRYAVGRPETTADAPVLEKINADFRRSGFRFRELMVSLVRWTEFP